MVDTVKQYIRNHEKLMSVLAMFYDFFMCNRMSGRKGIHFVKNGVFLKKCKVVNRGHNNVLIIEQGGRLKGCQIEFYGNNCTVIIKNDCVINGLNIWCSDGARVTIGQHTHITGQTHLAAIEGRKICVGERCLFSTGIVMRTGDSHSILDSMGKRINESKNVMVGRHCWIGQDVTILKNAYIGSDSIIGAGSLVTGKKFQPNCVIAGNPAKVIKKGVTWHHNLL